MAVAVRSLIRVSLVLLFFRPMRLLARFQYDCCHHYDGSHLLSWVIFPVRHAGAALEIAIATPEPLFVANILFHAEAPATLFLRLYH
jgi:hypothetical protein